MAEAMSGRSRRHHYYCCPDASRNGDKQCGAKPVPAEALEQIVREAVNAAGGEDAEVPGSLQSVRYRDTTQQLAIRLKDGSELALIGRTADPDVPFFSRTSAAMDSIG